MGFIASFLPFVSSATLIPKAFLHSFQGSSLVCFSSHPLGLTRHKNLASNCINLCDSGEGISQLLDNDCKANFRFKSLTDALKVSASIDSCVNYWKCESLFLYTIKP